jgi:fructose-1-phosphate kinase PfkB-like protein
MLIAGPNLTIDRTSRIAELRPGEVLRVADVAVTPGGKGLNVARAARALGMPATLVAFLPGHTGRAAAALIAEEGVELAAVHVGGEIRSTAVILEPRWRRRSRRPCPPAACSSARAACRPAALTTATPGSSRPRTRPAAEPWSTPAARSCERRWPPAPTS